MASTPARFASPSALPLLFLYAAARDDAATAAAAARSESGAGASGAEFVLPPTCGFRAPS
jgi:hypothetical protein